LVNFFFTLLWQFAPVSMKGAAAMGIWSFDERLARERRARLQAERLLACRSEELYDAHKKLSDHAYALSHTVIAQRQENAALIGRSTRTEAALEMATEKAVIAERRLWDALSAVEDGFAIFDRDWRLVVGNPAWMGAFEGIVDVAPGATYEAILRIAVEEGLIDLQGEHPDAWVARMLARWACPSIPQTDIRLFNGIYVRLIDKRTPEGDVVSLSLDITDTIRRERELERARDRAEAATRAKSAFLANMSHEIRTPMNGVVAMANLLRDTVLGEEQRLYADTIRNSGEALLVIINDILDYSKIDAGKLTLHHDSFDLQAMILEIFRLMRPGLEGKSLELMLDYDIFLPDRMIGDPGRIRQVLTNLIGNALKFTEGGHVTVHVVGVPDPLTPHMLKIRIVVEDTGIGIAPEMQAQIFGEFVQVEAASTRRFDGTGLGLAITRRLVALMGGEIWLESEVGVGSSFGLCLTLGVDPMAPSQPVEPLPQDRAAVWVVTGGQSLPHGVYGHLARLRAKVTETDGIDAGPLAPDAVILVRGLGVDPSMVASLRAQGFEGPILWLCPSAHNDDVPEGATALFADSPLLAVRRALIGEQTSPPAPSPPPVPPAPQKRLRVLAAEDNKTNQLVFRAMLNGVDLILELVEDGQSCVDAYRQHRPDLIFTDVSMPRMDGLEAARAIRAHEVECGLPPVPIIAMTAHAMAGDRERILTAGIDAYLPKPLDRIDLHAAIRTHAPGALGVIKGLKDASA
jgi:signal transduction histidine kinase/ActR/RegA family two-component response regulator